MTVKLKRLDGNEIDKTLDEIKEFEIEHANNILTFKCPFKTWELKDDDYKFVNGKIINAQ